MIKGKLALMIGVTAITIMAIMIVNSVTALGAGGPQPPSCGTHVEKINEFSIISPDIEVSGGLKEVEAESNFLPGQTITSGTFNVTNNEGDPYGIRLVFVADNQGHPWIEYQSEVVRKGGPDPRIYSGPQTIVVEPGQSVTVRTRLFTSYYSPCGEVKNPRLELRLAEPQEAPYG